MIVLILDYAIQVLYLLLQLVLIALLLLICLAKLLQRSVQRLNLLFQGIDLLLFAVNQLAGRQMRLVLLLER